MAIKPCFACGQRFLGRAANVYVAWFAVDGHRVCFKDALCFACFRQHYTPLLVRLNNTDSRALLYDPICGADVEPSEVDPTYLTVYLPKADPREFAIQAHAGCAVKFRGPVSERGEKQADRSGLGNRPLNTPEQDWGEALG